MDFHSACLAAWLRAHQLDSLPGQSHWQHRRARRWCSSGRNRATSRNTLAMIPNAGIEPQIIEYLKTPPDRATLSGLIVSAGMTVREALRQKESP